MTRTQADLNEVAADLDLPGTVELRRNRGAPFEFAWYYANYVSNATILLGRNATEAKATLRRLASRSEVTR